jgi:hypothetical protein
VCRGGGGGASAPSAAETARASFPKTALMASNDDALTSPTRLRVVRLATCRAARGARRAPYASALGGT